MPSLAKHSSSEFVKLLAIGDAKTGKTTALVALVKAGYKLRILDFDNLLDVLRYAILRECPDKLDNVEFVSFRDDVKVGGMGSLVQKPKAWLDSLKLLNHWKYTDDEGAEADHGEPYSWGGDYILVIDSLTRWCDACYAFHQAMAPKGKSGEADGRAIFGNAQDDMEMQLSQLTGKKFKTNVLVICHGVVQRQPDGTDMILPQGIGQKLSPLIPTYFPNYVQFIRKGDDFHITTRGSRLINLANGDPLNMSDEYPSSTGLADFFRVLRAPPKNDTPALRRIK